MRTVHMIDRGHWKPLYASDALSAVVNCPKCGHLFGLYDAHMIQPSGEVEPAVICPAACGFSGHLQLEAWDGANGKGGAATPAGT